MGRDSLPIPRDAYGYSLYYYTADYTPIGGTNPFSTAPAGLSTFNSLYNGNIAAMSTNITKLTDPWHYYTYRYDQLNRLKGTSVYKAGSMATPVTDYQENFTYDGNGNILTAMRNAGAAIAMDNLTYRYNHNTSGRLTNNELNYITDAVTTHNWPYGLNNQSINNYTYDAIGNMTADVADTISNINWTVYNKIQSLTNSKGTITYTYDPSGQRVSKTLNGITTWYIRDAQGNTLALYDNKHSAINWKEQDLYGSSRLGMWQPGVTLSTNNAQAVWDTTGSKQYELSNHLGNVLVTISDKRVQHSSNGTAIDYFDADIATAQEYYAFGGLMPGRTYVQASNYRYGFNGKENDNDVKGTGNQIDYGMRIYDPRVGKFLSVDPLEESYSWNSSYAFAENQPIWAIDLDGLEKITIHQATFAPFDYFGNIFPFQKPYKGDGNRGFNTLPEGKNNTSRIYSITKIDLATSQQIGETVVHSFPSIGPKNFYGKNGSTQASPNEFTIVDNQFGETVVSVNITGHDGRIDNLLAPDISWTGNYIFDTQTKGAIEVKSNVLGKGFPAYQDYIEDSKGQKVLLNTYAPPSKDAIMNLLYNSGKGDYGGTDIKIGVNAKGNFTGTLEVKERSNVPFLKAIFTGKLYEWKKYTIEDWNKKQSSKPAVQPTTN
ncbi:RHS repeat-associated core domain-containing protein [Mucilaginibacter mallensis]|uniref:RHS repeat-associated core domain-containing protein n=1 Tax=Mucilaginibacter mallensis TaxID=652787 RepID=A0A1H1MRG5_MUCMA|nr:RHS repeat-associated core domain-containing protein [Mucilaginibacter mallensis]SDR89317.1 RHS repeat-associated core domain-containing protein [Mucilaginibacter mallensis]